MNKPVFVKRITYIKDLKVIFSNQKVILLNDFKYEIGVEYILSVFYVDGKLIGELNEIETIKDDPILLLEYKTKEDK